MLFCHVCATEPWLKNKNTVVGYNWRRADTGINMLFRHRNQTRCMLLFRHMNQRRCCCINTGSKPLQCIVDVISSRLIEIWVIAQLPNVVVFPSAIPPAPDHPPVTKEIILQPDEMQITVVSTTNRWAVPCARRKFPQLPTHLKIDSSLERITLPSMLMIHIFGALRLGLLWCNLGRIQWPTLLPCPCRSEAIVASE